MDEAPVARKDFFERVWAVVARIPPGRVTPYGHSLYEFEAYGDDGSCLNYTVVCGDNSCDAGESGQNCPGDCGSSRGSRAPKSASTG